MSSTPKNAANAPLELVEVALSVPLMTFFTYLVPSHMLLKPGMRVRVPFGPRHLIGLVFGEGDPSARKNFKLRAVLEVLDDEPLVFPHHLSLARWASSYWFSPPGEAVNLLLSPRMLKKKDPPAPLMQAFVSLLESPDENVRLGSKMEAVLQYLKSQGTSDLKELKEATGASNDSLKRLEERGFIVTEREWEPRALPGMKDADALYTPREKIQLTEDQENAVKAVLPSLGHYKGFLLHGVTGSGKTEVYLELIEAVLARQEGALILVPEIALTPQLAARFTQRLGERVAVQHSGLSASARHEQWLRIQKGELPVVVGARSALFSPIEKLGIIIVDEEHEGSFKQESSPRYHARDLALVLGTLVKCPVILGSATPSLESWANLERKKLALLSLPTRAHQQRPLPEVKLIDMREETEVAPLISLGLFQALEACLLEGSQAMILINRRGYANFVQCETCGNTVDCPNCSVTFTWHQRKRRLICHYCDESRPFPEHCPSCGSKGLSQQGQGTEKIEVILGNLFPKARIARMDRDSAQGDQLISLIRRFREGKIDILIGTQMLAKGHDFPNVTLVGVLSAEKGLAFPDIRSAENTFQLLTQIAGRAGRGEKTGRVLIQSNMPEHYAIQRAIEHDVKGFLEEENSLRKARDFPPHSHFALFTLSSKLQSLAFERGQMLRQLFLENSPKDFGVTGPQAAPIERIKNLFRVQVLLKAKQRGQLHQELERHKERWQALSDHRCSLILDVDPHQFL